MINPSQYFNDNDLWDIERLKTHAQENFVYVIESAKYPGYVMLHYMDECQYDNKWSPLSRMARGMILDLKNKYVVAHPFEKFFNLGQMPETSYDTLQALGGFSTAEKLDGSMIICFIGPQGALQFTTKGSFDSEHGVYAATLPMAKEYDSKAFDRYAETGTLMFELVTKRYQIVIDYNKKNYVEGLYLIGYRDDATGQLASPLALDGIAEELRVPRAKTYAFETLDSLIETAKGLPVLEEGYVLRFKDDLLVKVKGNAYLEMHRFISHLSDRNILKAVGNNTADGLAALCPEEYRDEVVGKIAAFKKRIQELSDICYTLFVGAPKETRKAFALWVNASVEKHLRGFLFTLMDGRPLDVEHICRVIEEIDRVDGKTRI